MHKREAKVSAINKLTCNRKGSRTNISFPNMIKLYVCIELFGKTNIIENRDNLKL
jgi:hypothetical protein